MSLIRDDDPPAVPICALLLLAVAIAVLFFG